MYRISRRYSFESAHRLPYVPEGHRCRRLHGHHYLLEVEISATEVDHVGFIIDFWDLDKIVAPLVESVDHRFLNEIEGLENPTAELIAKWFFDRISKEAQGYDIDKVRVWETPECWAEYGDADGDI